MFAVESMRVGHDGLDVAIGLEDKQGAERIGEELTRPMYDRRFVVERTWTTGE